MRVGYKRNKPSLDITGCTKLLQVSVFRTAIMNIETKITTCIQVIQHGGMWVIIEIIMFSATSTLAFLKKKNFNPLLITCILTTENATSGSALIVYIYIY